MTLTCISTFSMYTYVYTQSYIHPNITLYVYIYIYTQSYIPPYIILYSKTRIATKGTAWRVASSQRV